MMGVLLLPPLHCLFPGSDPPPLPIHHLPLALVYALACILFHSRHAVLLLVLFAIYILQVC
ncbi:uncharacterized protein LOC109945000 [Zea mays]|uniref:uncharacterized protein LOC109945000 n=1 Tax=Zea mays TaxID=4577 RepID=UPI000DA7DFA7|nr:uncharacterized protein LOC109945000 [Zea mays]